MKLSWINITESKVDGKHIIGVGPFNGGWAYFFLSYYPFIHKIRELHPNAVIVASGYLSDWWYLRHVIDYYVGFEIDHNAIRRTGRNETTKDPTDHDVKKFIENKFGTLNGFIYTGGNDQHVHDLYKAYCTEVPKIECAHNNKSDTIAVFGRMKPGGRVSNNGNKEHWDQTVEYLKSKNFKVVVGGSAGGSYQNDSVVDLTTLEDSIRAELTTEAMEQCLCSIHDCSSTANYSQFIGNPTLIFNCNPRDKVLFDRRNMFGTLTGHCIPRKWGDWRGLNPMDGIPYESYRELWEACIDDFVAKCRVEKPFMVGKASNKAVFQW
jgi:hypothetical protein